MKHYKVIFDPGRVQISAPAGYTILQAAQKCGFVLNTACGAQGTCGKCLVVLLPQKKTVKACQYTIDSDLHISIPQTSLLFEQKILTAVSEDITPAEPDICKKYQTEPAKKVFGIAVDIGTTTVVAKLVDMNNGKSVATQAILNPQTKYGDDVISRIHFAETEKKLTEIHNVIIDCINDLITKLTNNAGISSDDIYELSAVGNTTMNHIFLKLPVSQLGQSPYLTEYLYARDIKPSEIAVNINPRGNIHTVENIAGFVGADTTAVALAVDIDKQQKTTLVIDIGTNGELILVANNKLYAASCAAGPALEGARIRQGSRGVTGAIEAVTYDQEDIDIEVIGDVEPISICGSGLIDAVAVMLEIGIIDHSGRFQHTDQLKENIPTKILKRITSIDNQPAFRLTSGKKQAQHSVSITQKDIRETQLAKAAIRTGIKMLQRTARISDSDIQQVFLAGAFGNYITPQSALRIGLLPDVSRDKIHFVGNAASAGARLTLISTKAREKTKSLASKIKYIEIAHEKDFNDVFADSLFF